MDRTDENLVALAATGDTDAFNQLVTILQRSRLVACQRPTSRPLSRSGRRQLQWQHENRGTLRVCGPAGTST